MSLLERVIALLPKIHGWCSDAKAKFFVEHILAEKPSVCVEIGVFGGSSLIPQAMALAENGMGGIIGIDPWTKDAALESMIAEEHREWWAKVDLEEIYRSCCEHIKALGLSDRVVLKRAKARDVFMEFQDDDIDLLHIDGNHSEDIALQDATLYLPKVRSGGTIVFDDIHWAEGGNVTVRKALTFLLEHCDRVDLLADRDGNLNCLVMKKR